MDTFTKCPRIKYTPSAIETEQPTFDAFWSTRVATVSPAVISVFPYINDSSTNKFSPSAMNETSLSSPESRYFTNNVKSVMSVEFSGSA